MEKKHVKASVNSKRAEANGRQGHCFSLTFLFRSLSSFAYSLPLGKEISLPLVVVSTGCLQEVLESKFREF